MTTKHMEPRALQGAACGVLAALIADPSPDPRKSVALQAEKAAFALFPAYDDVSLRFVLETVFTAVADRVPQAAALLEEPPAQGLQDALRSAYPALTDDWPCMTCIQDMAARAASGVSLLLESTCETDWSCGPAAALSENLAPGATGPCRTLDDCIVVGMTTLIDAGLPLAQVTAAEVFLRRAVMEKAGLDGLYERSVDPGLTLTAARQTLQAVIHDCNP